MKLINDGIWEEKEFSSLEAAAEHVHEAIECYFTSVDGFPSDRFRDSDTGHWYLAYVKVELERCDQDTEKALEVEHENAT